MQRLRLWTTVFVAATLAACGSETPATPTPISESATGTRPVAAFSFSTLPMPSPIPVPSIPPFPRVVPIPTMSPIPIPQITSPPPTRVFTIIPINASFLTFTAFNSNPIVVAVGGTVTWRNVDITVHTSTADNDGWSSGTIRPGGSFSTRFPTPGTFTYHCAIHPNMVGIVIVQ